MGPRGCSSQRDTDVPMRRIKARVEELGFLIWSHRQMIYTCLRSTELYGRALHGKHAAADFSISDSHVAAKIWTRQLNSLGRESR